MPERWRRKLGALGEVEPDTSKLRDRALHGPRLPDPAPSPARPVIAGIVAIALAVGSFGLLQATFGENRTGPDGGTPPTPGPVGAAPNPANVCDVPEYDPDVAILGGTYGWLLGPTSDVLLVPLAALEGPGEPGSTISGPATDELRHFLHTGEASNAPTDGWRAIVEDRHEVIFAAPHDVAVEWWIARFVTDGAGGWRFRDVGIVEQHATPAQLGRGLHLDWVGEVFVDEGRWGSTLSLTNGREAPWSIGEDGYELWGRVHVFDPETGREVGHAAQTIGSWGPAPELAPAASMPLPLSLGGAVQELESDARYDVVACVPELGLASPVGSLRVEENTTIRDVRVLTYPFMGASMEALSFGRLAVTHAGTGCLGLAGDGRWSAYVLWPDGHALVQQDGEIPVLIDAVGREVARLGQEVSLVGGHVPLENADAATIGGIPDACRAGGDGYFLTSGVADAP